MIRIVGGSFRGRRLDVPRSIRPTMEIARKAVFDILGGGLDGARVLDAAAGSGAYGLEALSRGAAECVFVEREASVRRILAANVEKLGVKDRVVIVPAALETYLARPSALDAPFDVIFHDPPYAEASPEVADELERLRERLAPEGTLVHERGDDADPLPDADPPVDRRRYGSTRLLIYRR